MIRRALAAATLALACAASAQEAALPAPEYALPPRDKDVAVVVGIERYQDIAAPSEFSEADALAFKKYLVSLGFRESNIQLMLNERATSSAFRKMETWLRDKVKPDSQVVFYYSGHGAPDVTTNAAKPEAYLLPYDGDPNYLSDTGYKVETLYEKLGKLKAQNVVVVMDACFSGEGGRSVIAKGARALVNQFSQPVGAIPPHMAVLTASKSNQMSASDPSVKHGVLTYNLLKALSEGKTDLAEIYRKIKPAVEDQAKGARSIDQSPQLLSGGPTTPGRFQFADAKALAAAKAEWEKANDQAAKKAAEAEALAKQKDAIEIEKKRLQEEAEAERRRMREEHARLERERSQREYAERQRLNEERRQLERSRRDAPTGEGTFVPPTF